MAFQFSLFFGLFFQTCRCFLIWFSVMRSGGSVCEQRTLSQPTEAGVSLEGGWAFVMLRVWVTLFEVEVKSNCSLLNSDGRYRPNSSLHASFYVFRWMRRMDLQESACKG